MEEKPKTESPTQERKEESLSGIASFGLLVWDFLKIIIIALVIIIPIRYFVFQPFIVSGSSMEPNFSNAQYLIIDEISYYFKIPQRGEVVVMRYPKDERQYFIKRVIGLPGETVKIDNGRVIVKNSQYPEGTALQEPYLSNQVLTFPHNVSLIGGQKEITLGDNEYFMMGDNRSASSDSRDWGVLKRNEIIGRVFLRMFPMKGLRIYNSAPVYSFN
jgi:signal peptidase I